MDIVFKFFDQITGKIPPRFMQMIRFGALLIWLIMATVVVFFAWQRGAMEAPQSGQDLSMASIRETLTRAENLNKPPDLTIPDINDLPAEDRFADLPYERRRRGEGLAAEDDSMLEPRGREEQRDPSNLPPYLSDTQSPNTDQVFPRNTYKPGRDPGAAGVRERPAPGQEIPVFDLDPAAKNPAPALPLRRPEEAKTAPGTRDRSNGAAVDREKELPAPQKEMTPSNAGTSPARTSPVPRTETRPPAPAAKPPAGRAGSGLDLLPVD